MMQKILKRAGDMCLRVNAALTRRCMPLGCLLALALAAALAVMNISSGPLSNMNDIGTWRSRMLFIALTACVHLLALLFAAVKHPGCFARMALRQLILTAGMYILLLAINQKTYTYVGVVQPIVRAMDGGGLYAGLAMEHHLSAPLVTLLYLITRLPVYDMYMVKLAAIGAYLLLALCALRMADRKGLGLRAEALLTLLMILPQAFLNAACTAQMETLSAALIALSLLLMTGKRAKAWPGALCFGAAVSLSGAALYALPLCLLMIKEKRLDIRQLAAALLVPLAACLPAIIAGMNPLEAAGSLLRAVFALPQYASGAPGVAAVVPRANPLEIPEMFALSRLPQVDTVTYAQEHYTQAHYEIVMRGFAWMCAAAYAGVCALLHSRGAYGLKAYMALALAGLMLCPAATMGAWLLLDVLCVYAIVTAPRLRLPACMVLFATAGCSCYPALGETLLPVIWGFVLCLLALCMLLDVICGVCAERSVDHE